MSSSTRNGNERTLKREDSLEYFIKFPPPQNAFAPQSCKPNDFVDTEFPNLNCDEGNLPVVLLFGWAGCQDRYLMKYSKIYEDQGFITIRYTASVANIFWERNSMKPIGQKIVKLLYDMNFDTSPIVLHVFSNGGAYLYQHFDLALKEFHTPLDIRGIIFDSSPGDRRIMSLYRAISSIYGKNRIFGCLISLCITFGLAARWTLEDIFQRTKAKFCSNPGLSVNPYLNLKALDNQVPQLFLYSNTDQLIHQSDIERFASFRQSIGVPVETVCFEDAEHVKLFMKYPQKYVNCVCQFMNNCLRRMPIGNGDKKLN